MTKKMKKKILLGVNIDHIATLRQQRLGKIPDLCEAAREAVKGGADQITMHLREDRRHIQDRDLFAVQKAVRVPINMEMALNPGIVAIARRLKPAKVCLVPEKRRELTTEGGLDVLKNRRRLAVLIPQLQKQGTQVSLFIDPILRQVQTAADLGAHAIELHTGCYAEARGAAKKRELKRLQAAAEAGVRAGLVVHAGHGLDLENLPPVCEIPEITELNIGYSIVAQSVFCGLRKSVSAVKTKMRQSR